MKVKVTVELDEGVKSTSEMSITSEMVLYALSQDCRAEKTLHIMNTTLGRLVRDTAKDACAKSINKIIHTIGRYGLLYQYDDKDNERQCYPIKDVEEFIELRNKVQDENNK